MVIDVFMLDVTRTLIYVETVQRLVIHYSCTLLVVGTTKHVIIYTGRGVHHRCLNFILRIGLGEYVGGVNSRFSSLLLSNTEFNYKMKENKIVVEIAWVVDGFSASAIIDLHL